MNAEFDVTNVILETERLILRPWRKSDVEDLFAYASVPGVGERAGWRHHESIEESYQILLKFIEEKKTFAIVDKHNDKVIGSLGVEKYSLEDKLTEFDGYRGRELGYVLAKDYWGYGYMPEAVKVVIDYLFDTLDYDFLLCGHYDINHPSRRVQEKCGFLPYRKLVFKTQLGIQQPGFLMLLPNKKKNIEFNFSHPETLVRRWGGYIDDDGTIKVNGAAYRVLRLLGKGKGGYSYLAEKDGRHARLKQIHHEPCSYYSFGDKIEAERKDYERIFATGIRIPKMLDVDTKNERIIKEYIDGETVFDVIASGRSADAFLPQIREMAALAKAKGLNIDYFPTNFVIRDGLIYYIDYECNDFMDEWSFENWGVKYWSYTPEFEAYLKHH